MEQDKLRTLFKQENGIDAVQFTRHANETTYSLNYVHWLEDLLVWKNGMPDYDGQYLVLIQQKQECGNIWKYQKVIECFMKKWVLEYESEDVIGWKKLFDNEIASV